MKKKSSGEKKIRQRLIVKGIVYGVFVTILQALLTPIFYRVSDVIESIMKSRVLLPPLGITFLYFGYHFWLVYLDKPEYCLWRISWILICRDD